MDSTDVFIFGDQTTRVEANLCDLILVRNDALLSSFLNESFLILQREISTLPAPERAPLSKFRTLGLFVEAIKSGKRHAALESACCCIYEIGYYMRCVKSHVRKALEYGSLYLHVPDWYPSKDGHTPQRMHIFLDSALAHWRQLP